MGRWKEPKGQQAGQSMLPGFEQPTRRSPRATVPGRAPTSRAAAVAAKEAAGRQAKLVLDLIRGRGDRGATIDEIDAATGIGAASVCPRVNRLAADRLIFAAGDTRPTRKGRAAKVWRAVRK